MWRQRRVGLLVAMCALVVAGCASQHESAALCSRVPRLETALTMFQGHIENLSDVRPESLEAALTGVIIVLAELNELPPPAVAEGLATLLRAYEELAVTFRSVRWDGTVAATDPAVTASIANLVRSDNAGALDAVRRFVERECEQTLPGPVGAPVNDATTLPAPSPVVEPFDEGDQIFDSEDSRLRSFGYLIAGSVGMAITSGEALCVGRWVGESFDELGSGSDRLYQESVQNAMQACVFAPDASTTLGSSPARDGNG